METTPFISVTTANHIRVCVEKNAAESFDTDLERTISMYKRQERFNDADYYVTRYLAHALFYLSSDSNA